MLSLFEGFQPQNVRILILFPTKHSYLLTAKTISDVNNWGYFIKDGNIP